MKISKQLRISPSSLSAFFNCSMQYKWLLDEIEPDPNTDNLFAANGFIIHNSAGVNTPADIVIIPSLYRFEKYGMNLISKREYKQCAGRSGRPKFST